MDLDEGFRELADSAPVMIWVSGADKLAIWFNTAWLDFVGREIEQELGAGWVEHLHPEDAAHCLNAYAVAFESRQPFSVEYRVRRHDGEYRWISDSGSPCTAEDGSFQGYLGSRIDVSERKQMLRLLCDTEERGRMFAEALPNLVWTCEPDGWCDYLGRQWVEYTGRPAEEQVGYGWAEHVHPDDRERVRAAWEAATRRGDSYDIEFRLRHASGVYRWFRTRAVPVRDASGNVLKWFGSNTDCHDYKQAETELRGQLERMKLHELVRARKALRSRDESGPPAAQRVFRVGLEEARKGTPGMRLRRRRREASSSQCAPAFDERRQQRFQNAGLGAIEGRRLRGANLELERRVRQRTLELEVANEEIEAFCQFAITDAHSPLRGIRVLATSVSDDFTSVLPLRAIDMLRRLEVNASRLEKLVKDLSWLGRLSRRPMSRERVDLDELVPLLMDELVRTHEARDIGIRTGPLGTCVGDRALLQQVFACLLSNALECTRHRQKALIEVGRGEDGDVPSYFVKDNGMGFDMNQAQRLFMPFQRLHAGGDVEGTGVGLAAVYRIVQRHGGQVWAEASPGRGATFFFTIPSAR